MSTAQFEIQLIASIVAVACALLGVFLVLRRMAMMSDAISHTVLLGIVIAFFLTRSITSPLLLVGAALMGRKKGDTVTVQAPQGAIEYTLVRIG